MSHLYQPTEILEKEDKDLIEEQKNNLTNKVKEIYEKLQTKDNLDEFLNEDEEDQLTEEEFKKAKSKGKCKLFIIIKFLGALLFITHLISIYELNSIINAIEEELMASAKSYLIQEDRDSSDDFYQNYNKINNKLPDYSVFFLSSFISQYLIGLIGFYKVMIITSIINILTLYFGFSNFEFNLDRNKYENYSLSQFIYLYIIYLVLCFSQGIIALVPLDIIKEGFIYYDKFTEKLEGKKEKIIPKIEEDNDDNNNNNKKEENLIENNNNNNNEEENKAKVHSLKYFFLFYLICITSSILIKILLDKKFIDEYNYSSRENVNFFYIICYASLIIITLLLYMLYSNYVLNQEKKNEDENTKISSMKLCGYVIYNENKKSENICCCEFCEDCKICCQTLNMSLCCYICSCFCCLKTIFCCQCKRCDENNSYEIRKNDDVNKTDNIIVFYRVTGRFNWFAKIMTDIRIYPLTIMLYFILMTNIGFEDLIWENFEKHNKKDEFLINLIILGTILVYYILNKSAGKWIINVYDKFQIKGNLDSLQCIKGCSGEMLEIILGLIPYILTQTFISAVLSALIYFMDEEMDYRILSITIGSVEYIKITILEIVSFYIETNYKTLEFFSSSTIFSIYLSVWNIIMFILSLIDIEAHNMIFFQFIIGVSIPGLLLLVVFFTFTTAICKFCCLLLFNIGDEESKRKLEEVIQNQMNRQLQNL